jgi:hypothetical protein
MPLFAVAVLASIFAERSTVTGLGRDVLSGDATGLTTFISAWFVGDGYRVGDLSDLQGGVAVGLGGWLVWDKNRR